MKLRSLLIVWSACAALSPSAAHALHPYRCAGVVQYRPCSVAQQRAAAAAAARAETPRASPKLSPVSSWYARVISPAYERLPSGDGLWRGRVEGYGLIELELQFLRKGIVESTHRLGRVKLFNKSSSFVLKSRPPRGDDWTWALLAHASTPEDLS